MRAQMYTLYAISKEINSYLGHDIGKKLRKLKPITARNIDLGTLINNTEKAVLFFECP